jgi:membrane protease YdiL (CAAX protease family)
MDLYSNLFALVGLFGPFTAALIMTQRSHNAALKKDYKDRLLNLRRIRPEYLPAIFLLMPFALLLSTWLSLFFGRPASQFNFSGGLATMLPIILVAPPFEELGWRGYGMDSLRSKYNLLKATLIFAIVWAIWHVPLFFANHSYQHGLWTTNVVYVINFFVSVFPAAVLTNWLYYKNDRSIVVAILFHMMLDLTSEAFQTEQLTKCVVTVVLLAISAIVIVTNRQFFLDENDDPSMAIFDGERDVARA